jgi:tetratricopeptide (TPR) repeat protein
MSELAELGITALKEGHRDAALRLLTEAVTRDPLDAMAWLWLSGAVESETQRADCLRRVLELEPDNATARAGLEQLEAPRRFSLIQCPVCGQMGQITCPKCGGSRTELCSACQGQTFRKCEACHGLGWVHNTSIISGTSEKWNECAPCSATGFVDCEVCRGRGRDWCHTCEGSGQVICPNCAPARLKPMLGEPLAEAVLSAIWFDNARAQTLMAGLQGSSPLAAFLWRIGFADRPYHSGRKLSAWVESHPEDTAGHQLLNLLPKTPYEQLPPRDKPVQLLKRQPPTFDRSVDHSPTLVLPKRPGNALHDAIMAARIGNRDQALVLLLQAVEQEPRNQEAWLWLSRLVETDAQRIECLHRVLEINPSNQAAQADLARLTGQ